MSYIASGVLGTVAGVLALGAVHLEVKASNDWLGPAQRGHASLRNVIDAAVNRDTKSDRGAIAQASDSVTISFRMPGVNDSSVVMRMPVSTSQADKRAPQPSAINTSPGRFKPTLACESQVSLLTAVAKQLQPGRCVT